MPVITFLVKTERQEGCLFFFGQEGGCKTILYDVGGGGTVKNFASFKKYPLPPPCNINNECSLSFL